MRNQTRIVRINSIYTAGLKDVYLVYTGDMSNKELREYTVEKHRMYGEVSVSRIFSKPEVIQKIMNNDKLDIRDIYLSEEEL